MTLPLDRAPSLCYLAPRISEHGDGRIAQLAEQLTLNQRVQGSNPCAPTIFFNNLSENNKNRLNLK